MERPATAASSSSFAGLLASLTAPAKSSLPDGEDDGLADDVAILSYESALRARTRSSAGGSGGALDNQPARAAAGFPSTAVSSVETQDSGEDSSRSTGDVSRVFATEADLHRSESKASNVKCARITLRLSGSEYLQLRARAAESELTVSAYLRTCILEVESLRAQVKDALARMRTPETHDQPQAAQGPPKFGPQAAHRWRERLFPHWRGRRRADCA